jgi:hypothetical protein
MWAGGHPMSAKKKGKKEQKKRNVTLNDLDAKRSPKGRGIPRESQDSVRPGVGILDKASPKLALF